MCKRYPIKGITIYGIEKFFRRDRVNLWDAHHPYQSFKQVKEEFFAYLELTTGENGNFMLHVKARIRNRLCTFIFTLCVYIDEDNATPCKN